MKNRILELLESDFHNSKISYEANKDTQDIGEGDIFNRYDYENFLNTSLFMVREIESLRSDLKTALQQIQAYSENEWVIGKEGADYLLLEKLKSLDEES